MYSGLFPYLLHGDSARREARRGRTGVVFASRLCVGPVAAERQSTPRGHAARHLRPSGWRWLALA